MIIKWLHILFGYLDIEIFGEFNERMLNLFSINNINVWNIYKNDEKIYVSIKIGDFKKVRKIRRKTKIKISIIKKHGLPFLLERNHLRYGFFVGVVFYFGLLYFLSLFVWQIKVEGNYMVESEEILSACEEVGLKIGTLKKDINSHNVRDKLLLNCDLLAWASINIEGSTITVNVSEIKNSVTENNYCNIVSDYNCVIKNILVQKGTAAVKVGDAVQKGNLLISGVVETAGKTHFTNATGVVTAEVEEKISVSVNKQGVIKEYINNGYKKFAVDFFSLRFPLYLGGEILEYDYAQAVYPLYLFGEKMPITLYRLEVHPFYDYSFDKSQSEIIGETENMFEKEMINKGITDYKLLSTEKKINGEEIITVFTVRYIKNIGIKENLLF